MRLDVMQEQTGIKGIQSTEAESTVSQLATCQ